MHFKFVQNVVCEYFPCHKGVEQSEFNCLFCYCPLYALKEECGGNFRYTDKGVKDCSICILPHLKGIGYDHIDSEIKKIVKMTSRK